jgi:UDPglucose 6-dehydrogenase
VLDDKQIGVYAPLTIQAIEYEEAQTTVYSIETSTGTLIASSGLICHNCFPKDVNALAYMAQIHGTTPQLLQAVTSINMVQRKQIVLKLEDLLGTLGGKIVGMLGLAFKENTDDIRESPALDIAHMLHEQGAIVRGYDPAAMEHIARAAPYIHLAEDAYDLARGCDALVAATPWNEFKSLDMAQVLTLMKQPVLVDGRNMYDPMQMKALGFRYRGVGRGYMGAMEMMKNGPGNGAKSS